MELKNIYGITESKLGWIRRTLLFFPQSVDSTILLTKLSQNPIILNYDRNI